MDSSVLLTTVQITVFYWLQVIPFLIAGHVCIVIKCQLLKVYV